MGYTRYWARSRKPLTQEFVDEVKRIIAEATEKGITICGWDGTGEPEITLDVVRFNGKAPHMDHETFTILNEPTIFDFCKTAEKPYDYAVKEVLKVAEKMGIVEDVTDDGEVEVMTDAQYLEEYGYEV